MAGIAAPAPALQSSPKAVLAGYLGGAVAPHVRVGTPLFTHVMFGVYPGIILWGGLWLRHPRLRVPTPLRG